MLTFWLKIGPVSDLSCFETKWDVSGLLVNPLFLFQIIDDESERSRVRPGGFGEIPS
tara:strand:- start:10525 stop:10695 length:171 start_codon:yes stop_codon:yes gene_type:complete